MSTPENQRKRKQILIALLSGSITIIFLEYFGFIYPSLRSRFFYFLARINRWVNANKTIEEQREVMDILRKVILREEDVIADKQIHIEGVPVEWVIPETEIDKGHVILYLHGGAYVVRTPTFHRLYTQHLADQAGTRVLLVDYRLAPEHPFPAALDDAYAAYRWLLSAGYRPEKIAVAGDSAGGGLTASLLLYLKEKGVPLPACALLMSPWLDLAGTGNSIIRLASEDPQLTWSNLEKSAALYCGDHSPTLPLISPLYGNLSGLPPMLIIAGGIEILLDDSIRFADRASIAGVDVELLVEPNMGHVWSIFNMVIPEAEKANRIAADFIRDCLTSTVDETHSHFLPSLLYDSRK
ncbi:MAG: alpha/beta hydrolase [Anaerolineae bacterium]|nr:alpha/beta hydrolase [Anaerolineae bacterium]